MEAHIEERIERWDTRPFSGGYAGLRDLADSGFSGAVSSGRSWLFMLNGKVVGVFGGTIENFDDAEGTTHVAPDPALPLLFAMQELGGEQQAQYYTNDTPVEEADATLSSGSFTGFIELSENVLSGDYYVAYYGGRSMPVAYIGNSERLLTGDEAFERANDEVGIYEVRNVDVDVVDIPGDDEPEGTAAGGAATGGAAAGGAAAGSAAAGSESQSDDGDDLRADDGATSTDATTTDTTADATPTDTTATAPATDDHDTATDAATTDVEGWDDEPWDESEDDGGSILDQDVEVAGESAQSDDVALDEDPTDATSDSEPSPGSSSSGESDDAIDDGTADETTARRTGEGRDEGSQRTDAGAGKTAPPDRETADRTDRRDGDDGPDERSDVSAGSGEPDAASRDGDREGASEEAPVTDWDDVPAEDDAPTNGSHDIVEAAAREVADTPVDRSEAASGDRTTRDDAGQQRDAAASGRDDRNDSTDSIIDAADLPNVESESDPDFDQFTTESPADPLPMEDNQPDGDERPFEGESEWRETRRIPSLNPDLSSSDGATGGQSTGGTAGGQPSTGSDARGRTGQSPPDGGARSGVDDWADSGHGRPRTDDHPGPSTTGEPDQSSQDGDEASADSASQTLSAFQQKLDEREETIDALRTRVDELETERDQLAADRDDLAAERDRIATEREEAQTEAERLAERVEELEATIDEYEETIDQLETQLERADVTPVDAARDLTEQEALQGTNLFVRYESKGAATLEKAHGGAVDADQVNENLVLEHHTQFEHDSVSVEGREFESYLTGTMEYRFVEWFIRDLLYEIRDTGHAGGLSDLYDAIPRIDRAQLRGEVTVNPEEGSAENLGFDVVLRDRMGNPLVVVDLNDSRDPATQEMMVDLQESATRVKTGHEELASAVLVTASFFSPDALETAAEATEGGFLSRDSKESYVKLSRKQGYHLCLVESRDDAFHVNVPEL